MALPGTPDRIDRQLLRRHRQLGDAKARRELVRRHTPMVRSLARHGGATGPGLERAVRVGIVALGEAIDAYDDAKAETFAAFAETLALARITGTIAHATPASRWMTPMRPLPSSGPAAPHRRDLDPRLTPVGSR